MSDFGTMKTVIADELVRDDINTQIGRAIQSAIKLWESTRFDFNELRLRLTTVDGQEYYGLSSITLDADGTALAAGVEFLSADSLTVTVNNDTWPLKKRTQQWLDAEQAPAVQYTGQPTDWGYYGNQFRLFPVPDDAYTLTISAHVKLGTLSAESDTNAWMVEGEALIRHQAKAIICRDVIRDMDGVTLAKDGVLEAVQSLERKAAGKMAAGRITPWRG